MCVCMYAHRMYVRSSIVCSTVNMWGSEDILWDHFSPIFSWTLGIELRSPGLAGKPH